MEKSDFVVRFAGEGGQGFLSAAVGFARASAQAGYHTQTFATFPSQITGGPTWMQARVSTKPVLSRGDSLDVLVAFNEYSYESHKGEMKDGGVILYDSDKLNVEEDAMVLGLSTIEVRVKGPGGGREAAVRALRTAGLNITSIMDVTPIPHNGCRPPKKRRV